MAGRRWRERGGGGREKAGERGMQVGSGNESSQVRGCYNITVLQPTTKQCRLSLEIKCMGAQAAAPNNSAASVGTLGVGGG